MRNFDLQIPYRKVFFQHAVLSKFLGLTLLSTVSVLTVKNGVVVHVWGVLFSAPSAARPRSLNVNDLTDKSVPALAAALAHLPNLKYLECVPHTLPPMVPLPLQAGPCWYAAL